MGSPQTPHAYHQASAVGEKRHNRGRRTAVTFESLECTGLPQISGEEEEEQPGSHRSEAGDQEEKGWRRGAKRVRGRREIKTARTGKAVGSTETMKRANRGRGKEGRVNKYTNDVQVNQMLNL